MEREYFTILGAEGLVEDISVDNVGLRDAAIVDAADGEGVAELDLTVSFRARVEYESSVSARVEYDDPSTWHLDVVNETIDQTEDVDGVVVSFSYARGDPSSITVEQIDFSQHPLFVNVRVLARPDAGTVSSAGLRIAVCPVRLLATTPPQENAPQPSVAA